MDQKEMDPMKIEVPIWEKVNLTLPEAAALFNIGINQIRDMTNIKGCHFEIFNGTPRLIKREKYKEYLNNLNTL